MYSGGGDTLSTMKSLNSGRFSTTHQESILPHCYPFAFSAKRFDSNESPASKILKTEPVKKVCGKVETCYVTRYIQNLPQMYQKAVLYGSKLTTLRPPRVKIFGKKRSLPSLLTRPLAAVVFVQKFRKVIAELCKDYNTEKNFAKVRVKSKVKDKY